MTIRLIVVCLGNICRSPIAEGVIAAKSKQSGLPLDVSSAGTGGWHIGNPPDARAIVAARLKGYDLSDQQARQLVPKDFELNDLILVMDDENLRAVEAVRPRGSTTPVELITTYSTDPEAVGMSVPDPYYTARFTPVIDMIELCADGLIAHLKSNNT